MPSVDNVLDKREGERKQKEKEDGWGIGAD
jgi:hypothetical protein